MKNFVRDGINIPVKLNKDANSGDPVLIGELFGFCIIGGKLGDTVTVRTQGVFEAKKDPAVAVSAGDRAYFEESSGFITTAASITVDEKELTLSEVGTIIKSEVVSAKTCEVRIV